MMGDNADYIFLFALLVTLYPFEINLTFLLTVGSLSRNLLFRFRSHLKRLLRGIVSKSETEKHKNKTDPNTNLMLIINPDDLAKFGDSCRFSGELEII